MPTLDALFKPKSVAIIGASAQPSKVGGIVIRNLLACQYPGKIYPINPHTDKIDWLQCYPSINALPETPELAVVAIPNPAAVDILEDIGKAGIHHVVMFTAGFRESGSPGLALEEKLITLSRQYNINILGPNCLGFTNTTVPINVTFGQVINTSGNIRFISQSGAIASSIFDWCEATGLGFSEFITLGNKAVLHENHILEYWLPSLNQAAHASCPIGLYLESIVEGKHFFDLLKQISTQNPIFILKPGKSKAAQQAMKSHTGSTAGEDAVLSAALKQTGAIRCYGLEDFFDLTRTLAWQPPLRGSKIAVISNAGGPAVISADIISEEGLELAEFDEATKQTLLTKLPRSASVLNPVDVLGDALAQRYADTLEIVLANPTVQGVVIILTPQIMTQIEETAQLIGKLAKNYSKPIVCSFMGGSHIAKGEAILNQYQIPSFRYPERAIKALAAIWRWQSWCQDQQVSSFQPLLVDTTLAKNTIMIARQQSRAYLDSFETNQLLKAAGISTPETLAVKTLDEAQAFAEEQGWPTVLKLISPTLLHKTEFHGVITGISSDEMLEPAFNTLSQRIEQLPEETRMGIQIQIQRQITSGIEVIVGFKKDPNFGPVLMFGAGGTFIELIADQNLHILPITQLQAEKLVQQSKIYQILKGYRGKTAYALDSLYDLMVRLGQLATELQAVAEMEINPVILTQHKAWAVDGKAILSAP